MAGTGYVEGPFELSLLKKGKLVFGEAFGRGTSTRICPVCLETNFSHKTCLTFWIWFDFLTISGEVEVCELHKTLSDPKMRSSLLSARLF